MNKTNDWSKLDELLLATPPVLFLGAGFSRGAINKANSEDGHGLKKIILDDFFRDDPDYEELEKMNLRDLCEEAYIAGKKSELIELLTESFNNTTVRDKNDYHLKLVEYPWAVIYSVNIDDLVEYIYRFEKRKLVVWHGNGKQPQNNGVTELIKLHGCVNYPEEGYIFSRSDYTDLTSSKLDAKLNEFTSDLLSKNVIFVGASLDEPDIEYYLSVYEKAGYTRTNQIFFIDPKPSRSLRSRVKRLDATLIEASAEEFINHVSSLKFNPNELEKARIKLEYYGVHRLSDVEKIFESPYDSKIYEGSYCKWQDVSEGWLYDDENYQNAKEELEKLLSDKTNNNHCYSVYGRVFSGKSCLIKKLAYDLSKKGFEILEYRGKRFNYYSVVNYIKLSSSKNLALLIDNASYYYEQIERLLHEQLPGKQLLILTASREYYHKRKRYYLEGNSFIDCRQMDKFSRSDACNIRDTLDKKVRLSYMTTMDKSQQVAEICRLGSVSNLIVGLTYGGVIKGAKIKYVKTFENLNTYEKKLLIELAILDEMEFEYYPMELFVERYGSIIDFYNNCRLTRLVDFIRFDEFGLSLNNTIIGKEILDKAKNKEQIILELLKTIANRVYEEDRSIWYILFQCLLKVEILEKRLRIRKDSIKNMFLELKSEYGKISYFWLQFGLFEQSQGAYVTALGYLEKSASIRPKAFKIQHALARNYMCYANSLGNFEKADVLFKTGESKMKALIESTNSIERKARPYSISSYVSEKVKFIDKFKQYQAPSGNDLKYMGRILEYVEPDDYTKSAFHKFYRLLTILGKTNVVRMTPQSPYFKFIGEKVDDTIEEDEIDVFD
ncbi:SIR2 family protein [Oribacterium sp. NK2B42]|uniref:SIR2 family protein n=1 Tax=Oribacterium sp. NK2B42 TaxID=689781 RepID=UPI0004124D19|nr:SIR2 family protein [Oribacterium sp. NK2B42]